MLSNNFDKKKFKKFAKNLKNKNFYENSENA